MKQEKSPYIKGLLIIIASWWIIGSIIATFCANLFSEIAVGNYLMLNSSFIPFFLSILLTFKYLLKIDPSELFTTSERSHLNSFFIGSSWLLLLSISAGLEYLIEPERFTFSANLSATIAFIPIAILVTPLQTASEELFFRAYLAKWMEYLSAKRYMIILFSGILFLAVHLLNPEIQILGNDPFIYIYYFLFGAFMMAIALLDNSFILPIIIHTVNNLFSVILVNYRGTVLDSPALFIDSHLNPLVSTITLTIGSLLTIAYLRSQKVH